MIFINRRKLVGGLLAVACDASLTLRSRGESIALSTQLASATQPPAWRTIFQPNDQYFPALLLEYFPGYSEMPFAKTLLPYTAIIRNGGRRSVKAYTFWWKASPKDGTELAYSQFFCSRVSKRALDVFATGYNSILGSQQYAIVTPSFLWSSTKYQRALKSGKPLSAPKPSEGLTSFLEATTSARRVRLTRGGKIQRQSAYYKISDSSVENHETVRNAERATAISLLAWLNTNQQGSNSEIVETLLRSGRFGVDAGSSQVAREAASRYAVALSNGIKKVGVAGMLSRINQVAARQLTSYTIRTPAHV